MSRFFYLPPKVARCAYFHGRDIFFAMKYFSDCTYVLTSEFGGLQLAVH